MLKNLAAVPWPVSVTRQLARDLWLYLEPVVNKSDARSGKTGGFVTSDDGRVRLPVIAEKPWPQRDRLRQQLDGITRGRPPDVQQAAIPLRLVRRGRSVRWMITEPVWLESPAAVRIHEFTILLLWNHETRPLLRRCVQCARFVLLSQKPRRPAFLCSARCRRLRKRERPDPTRAARQRAHRRGAGKRRAQALEHLRAATGYRRPKTVTA